KFAQIILDGILQLRIEKGFFHNAILSRNINNHTRIKPRTLPPHQAGALLLAFIIIYLTDVQWRDRILFINHA
ncbi:MAG: hypothetical protein AB7W37_18560, partial [Syntrophobacteraceae bacterium]